MNQHMDQHMDAVGVVLPMVPEHAERPEAALLALIQELQELLNTGMAPAAAWNAVGVFTDHEGIPYTQAVEHRIAARSKGGRLDPSTRQIAHVLIAISRVSHSTGIGFSALLNSVHESLSSAIMLDRHRTTAISGPRASAQILQGLPLLGIAAAFLIGVNPLGWFVSSGLGALCATIGVALLIAGRRWSLSLITHATGDPNSA